MRMISRPIHRPLWSNSGRNGSRAASKAAEVVQMIARRFHWSGTGTIPKESSSVRSLGVAFLTIKQMACVPSIWICLISNLGDCILSIIMVEGWIASCPVPYQRLTR